MSDIVRKMRRLCSCACQLHHHVLTLQLGSVRILKLFCVVYGPLGQLVKSLLWHNDAFGHPSLDCSGFVTISRIFAAGHQHIEREQCLIEFLQPTIQRQ